jgi:hypothetical protein
MTGLDLYDAARIEMGSALGLDLDRLSPADSLRLSAAVSVRLELDAIEAAQRAGQRVDLASVTKASEALRALLARPEPEAKRPAAGLQRLDLSKLSDHCRG